MSIIQPGHTNQESPAGNNNVRAIANQLNTALELDVNLPQTNPSRQAHEICTTKSRTIPNVGHCVCLIQDR